MNRYLQETFSRGIVAVCFMCFCLITSPVQADQKTKFTIKGDMDFAFNWVDEPETLSRFGKLDTFSANQRLRLFLTARTSDSLSFFGLLRIRPHAWGRQSAGYALDADGVNLRVRQLRLDWREPGSPLRVRFGMIPVVAPGAAFFSSVMFSSAGGAEVGYDITQNVALKLGYYRPYDDYDYDKSMSIDGSNNLDDDMNMLFLSVPISYPSIQLEPWAMYANIGKDSSFFSSKAVPIASMPNILDNRIATNDHVTVRDNGVAWWGGISGKVQYFDPLSIKFDFVYGRLETGQTSPNYNAKGWYADIAVDYKTSWGTPGIFGWYATGSDYDDVTKRNQWGYTPTVSAYDEGFNPTSFGFAGASGVATGNIISRQAAGHWGLGIQVKDIPSFGSLKHLVRVAYYEGTNDKQLAGTTNPFIHRAGVRDNTMLTKGDSVYEVNVNHEYPIYPNLVMSIDTGYLQLDRGSHWRDSGNQEAWQFVTNLKYSF